MRIYVSTEGLEKLQKQLYEMVQRGKSLSEPLGKAGQIILHSVSQNFESEGRPTKWPQRSPLTQMIMDYSFMEKAAASGRYGKAKKWKTKAGILRQAIFVARGHKLLQVSGDLRKSIHMDIKNGELAVGSALRYARIHQMGGEIRPKNKRSLFVPIRSGRFLLLKKVKIPARPYLVLQHNDNQKVIRIFEDWLAGEK